MSTIPLHSRPSGTTGNNVPSFAIRVLLTHLYDSLCRFLSCRRPWLELVDRNSFSRPRSVSDTTLSVCKNLSYFRVNYLTLIAAVLCLSFISHPASLLALLVLLAAWLFFYSLCPFDQPLIILERTFSDHETLGFLVLLSMIVIFLTYLRSLLMSTTLIRFGMACIHHDFMDLEDLILDDQELNGFGLFSFSGSTGSANDPGVPTIVSLVWSMSIVRLLSASKS